jgi:hypothetical protein
VNADDELEKFVQMFGNPLLFATLTRFQDATTENEKGMRENFKLINNCATRIHWERLACPLVVALCFAPESIGHFVKRCRRKQPNGKWTLSSVYIEILFEYGLYDVFDYHNSDYDSLAWKNVFLGMSLEQLQRKHPVPPSSSPIESLIHNKKWPLLMELVILHPELLHYLTYDDDGVNPGIVARALTANDDAAVKKFVLQFIPMIARQFGPGIFTQPWFKKVWTFPTSVTIPAFSTWAMMPPLAGNWMALCELLYVMAMYSYNKLALVSTVFHKFTKSVFIKTKDVEAPWLPVPLCERIWAFYGEWQQFEEMIGITNSDGQDLRGVLQMRVHQEPIATLFIQLLNNEGAMNDFFRLKEALSQLRMDVQWFPLVGHDINAVE